MAVNPLTVATTGQTLTVAMRTTGGATPSYVFTDVGMTTLATWPATITTDTTWYLSGEQTVIVSVLDSTVELGPFTVTGRGGGNTLTPRPTGTALTRVIAAHGTALAGLPGTYAAITKIPVMGNGFRMITAVVYHGVATQGGFAADMDRFQEWNYTTVTLDQVADFFDGIGTLPAKPLLITFDDGCITQYTNAYPELLARGMTATFYMVPDWVDGLMTQGDGGFADASPFTWANATTMQANGMKMQSHSQHHTNQTTLTQAQVTADFMATKARIEAMVSGSNVRHIAYPYGMASDGVKAGLIATGVCRTGRLLRINEDGSWPVPNGGGYDFIFPTSDRYGMPCAGAGGWGYVAQENYYHQIARREELVPDYGFEAGGKGWTIGTGFSIDSTVSHSGTKSLKATTTTSSQSSSNTRLIPIERMALIEGSVWMKLDAVPTGGALIRYDVYAADGTMTVQSNTALVTTQGTADWTQYTWNIGPIENAVFLRIYCWTANVPAGGTVWFDDLTLKRMHGRIGPRPSY